MESGRPKDYLIYTTKLFNDFIKYKVLPRCNPYPRERSIIIMDNAAVHIYEAYYDGFYHAND
jgi:hypothetical protein